MATGRERHAVAQVATGASCTSARPISCGRRAWPLHPLTNSSSGYCHRMAGAVQVFAVTADWRVSRPWVRQSTAQSHHQLLPACGARGACKRRISTRAGRWCSGCGLSSGAQGPRHRDADTTIFVSSGARSGGIRSCGWFSRSIETTLAIAERPIGVCRGRESVDGQSSHLIGSALHQLRLRSSRCSARLP